MLTIATVYLAVLAWLLDRAERAPVLDWHG